MKFKSKYNKFGSRICTRKCFMQNSGHLVQGSFQYKYMSYFNIGNPIIKIRRSSDRLIFIMGIPIHGKRWRPSYLYNGNPYTWKESVYIETGTRTQWVNLGFPGPRESSARALTPSCGLSADLVATKLTSMMEMHYFNVQPWHTYRCFAAYLIIYWLVPSFNFPESITQYPSDGCNLRGHWPSIILGFM